jgi:hypothetical protein
MPTLASFLSGFAKEEINPHLEKLLTYHINKKGRSTK